MVIHKYDVLESSIDKLNIYSNTTEIARSFDVDVKKGRFSIFLRNIEVNIDKASIRVYAPAGVKIDYVSFSSEKVPRYTLSSEDSKTLLRRLEELKDERQKIQNEIQALKIQKNSIEKGFEMLFKSFSANVLNNKVTKELFEENLQFLNSKIEDIYTRLSENNRRLDSVNKEIEALSSRLKEQSELIEVGVIHLVGSANEAKKYKFKISYLTKVARWVSSYDLLINSDDTLKLQMFAEIIQQSNLIWNVNQMYLYTRSIVPTTYQEPNPWYIYTEKPRIIHEKRTLRPKATRKAFAEAEILKEEMNLAFSSAEIEEVGENLVFSVSKKVILEPNEPLRILLNEFEYHFKKLYYWDAFAASEAIELVEFINDKFTLLPGSWNIFKEASLVNHVKMPKISPKQKIKLAVERDYNIEVEKRLIERKESKRGLIKDKAYIKYTYKLTINNHKRHDVLLTIVDRLPLPKDPNIEVVLDSYSHKPDIDKLNIIKWNLNVPMNEKIEITYTFTIKYPPEYVIFNVP